MAERPLVAIVDDDKSIRNATSDLLKAAGFSPAAFEDAESFLGWPTRASVACLVADMRMPGMSGLELYEALVADGHTIPTVIITAHPEETTQLRARAVGIRCYLSKPFAPDELLECVGGALANSRGDPIPKS
jgi:FixJ family two-component response regulator